MLERMLGGAWLDAHAGTVDLNANHAATACDLTRPDDLRAVEATAEIGLLPERAARVLIRTSKARWNLARVTFRSAATSPESTTPPNISSAFLVSFNESCQSPITSCISLSCSTTL